MVHVPVYQGLVDGIEPKDWGCTHRNIYRNSSNNTVRKAFGKMKSDTILSFYSLTTKCTLQSGYNVWDQQTTQNNNQYRDNNQNLFTRPTIHRIKKSSSQ